MKNLIITVYIKNEPNRLKAGEAPVYFKLKANNTITTFPANVYVNPLRWEHTNKFTERKRDINEIKIRDYINDTIKDLNKIEERFIEAGTAYTAEMIKNRVLEKDAESLSKNKTVADAFKFHKEYFMDLVKKGEMKKSSYKKYHSVEEHLNKFIKQKHSQTEYPLANIDNKFQEAFHLYLSGALGKKNTVIKYIILFRRVIRLVSVKGWLKEYPLEDYKMKREKPTRYDVLTPNEIQSIIKQDYEDAKLNKVKDYFLFQLMTGLAYTDFIHLEQKHIVQVGSDMVLMKSREKTNEVATVNLQPLALEILERWSGKNETNPERCFPYISNKEYNLFVKVVAKIAGITKNVTTHLARHTFGCLLVLNKVDQKAQQIAFGHSSGRMTELYARMFSPQAVTEQKKLDGVFNLSKIHLKKAV